MDLTEEHKKEVQRKIVETVISSLEQDKITEAQFDEISAYILEKVEPVKTHHDLIVFLRELSAKWNIFSFILTLEDGEVKKIEQNQKADEIQQIVKTGNIDDALNKARQVVEDSAKDTYGS